MNSALVMVLAVVLPILMFAGGLAGGSYLVYQQQLQKLKSMETVHLETLTKEKEKKLEGPKDLNDFKDVASDLNSWREELDKKKQKQLKMDEELIRRQNVLNTEQQALDKEKDKILQMQKDLESKLLTVETHDAAALKDLADLFAKMKPIEAVNFLRSFPEEQTTKIMTYIPKKQLVKILEAWTAAYPNEREKLIRVTSEIRKVIEEPAKHS